jgi:hypothetical protein
LDESFEAIVSKITQDDLQYFNEALDKNRGNVRFFVNQIEQQRETIKDMTTYKRDRLSKMIEEFK